MAGPVAQPLLSQQTKKTITKLRYRPQACPVPSAIIHKEFLVKTCGKYGGKRSGCHLFSGLTSRNGSKGHHHGTAFTRTFLKSDIVDLCDSVTRRIGGHSLVSCCWTRGSGSRITAVIDETSQHLDFFTCINIFLSDCEQHNCIDHGVYGGSSKVS